MGMITESVSINAENMFTDVFFPPGNVHYADYGQFTVSVSGTFVATITLQRSFDNGATWKDVEEITAQVEKNYEDFTEGIKYRAGVKTGGYTSGTAEVILAK